MKLECPLKVCVRVSYIYPFKNLKNNQNLQKYSDSFIKIPFTMSKFYAQSPTAQNPDLTSFFLQIKKSTIAHITNTLKLNSWNI